MSIDPRAPRPFSTAADPSSALTTAMQSAAQASQDLARRVSTLEQQRTVIGAKSLGGTVIADGAIVASHITAGNVVASIMTANLVNASHIDANSVRTSILNATAIVTQGLQTQVLTAVQAAISDLSSISTSTGTLTASLIRTAASGSRVELGATVGGIKGYNASNVLTFGFDTTTGAATVGAITVTGANGTSVPASTLTGFVGGGNLLKDSSFESTDPALPGALWLNGGTGGVATKQTTQAFHGTKSLRVLYGAPSGGIYGRVNVEHGVPMGSLVNRPVVYSAWVYITGTDNTTPASNISLSLGDQTGDFATAAIASIPKNAWLRVVLKATVPSTSTDLYVKLANPWSSGNNTVYYDGVQLELGDAATAYNPKADEILYGQINTTELAAGAVTASAIAAGAITAGKISLGTAESVSVRNGNFSEGNPADGTSLGNGWALGSGIAATVQTSAGFGRTARIVHSVSGSSWTQQDVTMPVGRNVVRCWIKTTGVTGTGAVLNVDGIGATGTFTDSPVITGTTDWTLVEAIANVTAAGTVRVYIQLGYSGSATGTAEFANVHVVPAITGTTLTPNAVETLLVTGGVVRTAASGARVELDSTNGLRVFNSGGTTVFQSNLAGAVSLTGTVYAKTGMTMDAGTFGSLTDSNKIRMIDSVSNTVANIVSYIQAAGPNIWTDITSGYSGSGHVNVRSRLVSIAGDGSTSLVSAYSFTGGSRTEATAGSNTVTIIDSSSNSSFVQTNFGTALMRLSTRGSAAFSVAAGATTNVSMTGNLPGGSTPLPIITLQGTNAQKLSFAWVGLSGSVDIYNPTGATISGIVYWMWIVY